LRVGSAFYGTTDTYNAWVDYTLTTPPTRSPSPRVLPTIDPTVLQRADDMTWETAVDDVRYFSPDQQGGIYGKIFRKYFTFGPLVNGGNIIANDADFITATCRILGSGGGGFADNDVSYSLGYNTSGGTLTSVSGGADDDFFVYVGGSPGTGGECILKGWVDYTISVAISTRPTGQPFADPSSGLLKNVSTGKWEIPVNETEYFNHRLGPGGRSMQFEIALPALSSYEDFPMQPSITPTRLLVEGNVDRSGDTYVICAYNSTTGSEAMLFRISSGVVQYFMGSSMSANLNVTIYYK